ncbi:hypothetical protein F5884DRAFT_781741 [Xylogone sp. PMI_703]|nr:hypothetical protein F5884DRAFT_781741 [Xylogone sp. PMI_703]
MAPMSNNIAFTAPINPPGATPVLTRSQIWAGLLLKIRSGETFVPNAIESTTVVTEGTDPFENPVTTRDVIFIEGKRKVREVVTAYADARVDFLQPDGSKVSNIISEGAEGELYMTYVFEWRHSGVSSEELAVHRVKEKTMAQMAVQDTIKIMRELAKTGSL